MAFMQAMVAPNGAVQVLTAAVTPVVLVSATAILISGVNSRYISIAERMRALAHEYRDPACTAERRVTISYEMHTFLYRVHVVAWAVRMLYSAVGAFVLDTLIISATLWRQMLAAATLPLFLLGVSFILAAIVLQLLELHSSNRTLALEVKDVPHGRRL